MNIFVSCLHRAKYFAIYVPCPTYLQTRQAEVSSTHEFLLYVKRGFAIHALPLHSTQSHFSNGFLMECCRTLRHITETFHILSIFKA